MGVFLKGDVPILMSRESADVWASRRYFDLDALAGAPPDMFSPKGQNWGFPGLRLGHHWRADGYAVVEGQAPAGREVFSRASRRPRAGVLPHLAHSTKRGDGPPGHFSPSAGMDAEDLRKLGFDTGRIRWLTLPHITGKELETALGSDAPRIARAYLSRIGSEDMYNLSEAFDSEAALLALGTLRPSRTSSFPATPTGLSWWTGEEHSFPRGTST